MHLSPREIDKLLLHNAGFVAQKRLARGLCLNHPEAVALIATQLLEFIREGRRVAELMDLGRKFLGRRQTMRGVPALITEVQVEGTFPDGTKLVTVHHPIASEDGNLELALYGSFLPVPKVSVFKPASSETDFEPGSCQVKDGELELNAGRGAVRLAVTNLGDRPIQVGSHYHFIETAPGPTANGWTFPPARQSGSNLVKPKPCRWWISPGNALSAAVTTSRGARCRTQTKPPRSTD